MNDVKVFDFDDQAVRVIDRDGEPWFVATDVCRALDLDNNRQALARLDDDEKGVISTDTLGGKQSVQVVSESGLYALVLGSRKPEAKRFKRWVTHEVLPSIRRTGRYAFDDDEAPLVLPPPRELNAALRLIETAQRVEGLDQARALWRNLRLPLVPITPADVVEDPLRRAERLAAAVRAGVSTGVLAVQEGCTRRSVQLSCRFSEGVCPEVKSLVAQGLVKFAHARLLADCSFDVQRHFAAALAAGEMRTEDDVKCFLAALAEGALEAAE